MSVHYRGYVLLSQDDNRLYTGCTHNLERGRVRSTAHRVPLELIYSRRVGTVTMTMHSAVSGSFETGKGERFWKNRLSAYLGSFCWNKLERHLADS